MNKKNLNLNARKIYLLIIAGLFLLFSIHNVEARGLSITPGITTVQFQPGYKFSIDFSVSGSHPKLKVSAGGDFEDYVEFDKERINLPGTFTAYISLPQEAHRPGKNRLYIKVEEDLDEEEEILVAGIRTKLALGALILIKVPYPGKYAEIEHYEVNAGNEGEPVIFNLLAESYGKESVDVISNVLVYSDGHLIDDVSLGSASIPPAQQHLFRAARVGSYYKSGDYNSTAFINFEGISLNSTQPFRVGALSVDIIEWTKEVNTSKISPYKIVIESKWNNDLDNVHATVSVTRDDGRITDTFTTPSITLGRWERETLEGYIDAQNMEPGKYNVHMTVRYPGGITVKRGSIKVVDPDVEIPLVVMWIIGFILMLLGIGILFLMFFIVLIFLLRGKLKIKIDKSGSKKSKIKK